jgi:hydroxyethylthiazole kinase-like uncharacterized protein yjeF
MPDVNPIQLQQFSRYLQPRPRAMHKGSAGHVLIVGGSPGFTGAARMAANAALRVGAGLVSIASLSPAGSFQTLPEVMCHFIQRKSDLTYLLSQATVIVLGPGMGQSRSSRELLQMGLSCAQPLVVDADGLNLLAQKPCSSADWVLTPHPGEAARLLKTTATVVQSDRVAAAKKLQQTFQGVAVLKGAGTLVVGPDGFPAICNAGNPGMASGGMGDVLSGVIGGLIAQGIPLADAARLGVVLHATAGDLAASAGGERGLVATDLMPYLRQLVNPEQSLQK